MSSVYTEQQKLLLSLKKSLTLTDIDDIITDINIPPRKLLSGRSLNGEMFSTSSDSDPYSSDNFRMFEFKIRRCNRSRSHDWTDCPFAHPGEKARRRDPRRFQYSGEVCPEYGRGCCSRGDACEISHGVFECWLHPARYRTKACKDGKKCKRKICFFAHTPGQLRVLPLNNHNCCSFCHHHCSYSCNSCSPTSTLFSYVSFSSSPPLSPSRFVGPATSTDMHVLNELMCSLETLNFGDPSKLASSCKDYNYNQLYRQEFTSIDLPSVNSGSFCTNGKMMEVVDDVIATTGTGPDLGWVNDLLM